MEFSLTQRGNHVLLYGGYEYTKYRENEKDEITWRCRVYFATKCRAFLRTYGDNIIGIVPQHCHDSNPQKARASIIKIKMKQDMKAVGATPRNILGNNLLDVNMDVLQHLPKLSSLTRNLFRSKVLNYTPNPATANFFIPESYGDLILHDTGAYDSERILAIGDNNLLSELRKDFIFGDGTFDKAPSMFYQLYTWHAKVGNNYPPCIYFLLKKRISIRIRGCSPF